MPLQSSYFTEVNSSIGYISPPPPPLHIHLSLPPTSLHALTYSLTYRLPYDVLDILNVPKLYQIYQKFSMYSIYPKYLMYYMYLLYLQTSLYTKITYYTMYSFNALNVPNGLICWSQFTEYILIEVPCTDYSRARNLKGYCWTKLPSFLFGVLTFV